MQLPLCYSTATSTRMAAAFDSLTTNVLGKAGCTPEVLAKAMTI